MLGAAVAFVLLMMLPVNFAYWAFAAILLVFGISMGAFASPNRAAIMNSLPPRHRGAGGGMNATFQSSAQVLSIGLIGLTSVKLARGQDAQTNEPEMAVALDWARQQAVARAKR